MVCISRGKHCPGRCHLCQAQLLRAKECASKSSKRPWWGGHALTPLSLQGMFSLHTKSHLGSLHKPILQIYDGFWYLGCGGNASQAREHQQPQEHPSASSISFSPTNLLLPSPAGKAVTFFYEEGGKAKGEKCPGTCWRRRKRRQSSLNCCTEGLGTQQRSRKSHQEELQTVMVNAVFHVQP